MRVSYDWLKTMIDIPEDPKTLSDEYIRTGTEVEAIDTVGESFDHVVTSKVLTKTPHPDSDHMYVCSVDVGDKNLDADGNPAPLQIVCGAQNFEAGDHIVTAMIGAVLPGDVKIKKSKLRGVVSMGMNCSARELGLGGDHSGIMILPEDTPCGMPFAEYVGSSDTVLDCEITPNRPDCLSMIGMARETGAIFDRDFHVELPVIKAETGRATDDELSVEIADEGLCDRYVARIVRNVKVGPSPDWMVKRLNALGVRPHNNIVDITNYVMMLTGQPLHAFDLDTFAERDGHRRVVVRAAQQDEKFTTLDGEERVLDAGMGLITDGERPVALAGVMGGMDSEIEDDTVDVMVESACFNAGRTSHTSRDLSLISDAPFALSARLTRLAAWMSPTLPARSSRRSPAARLLPAMSMFSPRPRPSTASSCAWPACMPSAVPTSSPTLSSVRLPVWAAPSSATARTLWLPRRASVPTCRARLT